MLKCKDSILVSILVPIYNSEQFLPFCIESLLSQTYENIEIILVNDGSKDGSENLCKAYLARDKRIKYFKKENGGVSSARNWGLRQAKGEWCIFVDSDDMLPVDAVSSLVELVSQDDVDFGIAGYDCCNGDGSLENSTAKFKGCEYVLSKDDGIKHLYRHVFWQWFICSKIFKIEILKRHNIEFNERIFFGEDRLFIMQYVCAIQANMNFTSKPTYIYRIHDNSVQGVAESCLNVNIVTGLEASILMYKEISKIDTTRCNKYMALEDVVCSYRTVRRELKRFNVQDEKLVIGIDRILHNVVPTYKYYIMLLFRKVCVSAVTLRDIFVDGIRKYLSLRSF